ncbi:MAG: non-homologous end joining protein Ku [Phycisphaerae bacterium]
MARAIWSGSISFGLVNIPVRLFSAVRDHTIHFHMLSKDGTCRLRRKLVCPDTGEEYDFKDTARGFEIAPDQYVIVNDEELESLKPEAGRTIEIQDFVELSEIDPVYYERPYYLLPDEGGEHAYQLLLEALNRSQKVGIAKFVMRSKEYLAALRPTKDVICLETMRFADEVVPAEELAEDLDRGKIKDREVSAAEELVEALVAHFEPDKYRDEYRERVQELIDRKSEGQEIEIPAVQPEEPARLVNLMDALQRSLARAREEGRGGKTTKPPAPSKHRRPASGKGRRRSA